jgi:hypothetical protein
MKDEKDLRMVDTIDESKLRPEFVEEMEKIRQNILKKTEPKKILGKNINGAGLYSLNIDLY